MRNNSNTTHHQECIFSIVCTFIVFAAIKKRPYKMLNLSNSKPDYMKDYSKLE